MTKMLKTQAKIAWGNQIAYLVPAAAPLASIEGRPPFPAQPIARAATPGGATAAPLSLPLPVTPCSILNPNGGAK